MEIPLTQGQVALVDDADANLVSGHRWYAKRCRHTYYAVTHAPRPRRRLIYMHNLILRAAPGLQVDHENRNGCDNRRVNLRFAGPSEQRANSRQRGRSGYRGVRYFATGRRKPWQAQITIAGRTRSLGYFWEDEAAARAYDAAALAAFGEFAQLNYQ